MFIDPHQFGFVAPLESQWRAIRAECEALPEDTLIFDDTTIHEAWNRSSRARSVLLFDFVRPGCEGAPADEPPTAVRELIDRRTGR